jgi:hypothetical protein
VRPPEMMVAWWDETRVRRPDDDGGIWVILGGLVCVIKGKEKDLWARNCGMARIDFLRISKPLTSLSHLHSFSLKSDKKSFWFRVSCIRMGKRSNSSAVRVNSHVSTGV